MNDIPPEMLADVLHEIEEEKDFPDKYSVSIQEIYARLIEKGYCPEKPMKPMLH